MNAEDVLSRMVSSGIIIEPKLIWDLLYIYKESSEEVQTFIIDRLIELCKKSIHNPLILLNNTTQTTPDNTKLYILNLLVDLALSSSISDKLFDLISYLVYYSDIKKNNILHLQKSLLSSSSAQLLLIIRFFQLFLISKKIVPHSFYYFNSTGSGINLLPMNYPFAKAITMCA